HDAVANGEALHLGADVGHCSGDLQTHDVRVAKKRAAVGTFAVRQVSAIDTDRRITDQKIVGSNLGSCGLSGYQDFGATEVIENYGLHLIFLFQSSVMFRPLTESAHALSCCARNWRNCWGVPVSG